MNPIAEEIRAIIDDGDSLTHIGVKYRSGRYPYGSGDQPYQHGMDFLGRYETLKKSGKTDVEIAKELNMLNDKGEPSTGILRLEKKWANDMRKINQMQTANALKKDGLGPTEIGRKMGLPESTVRSLLDPNSQKRTELAMNTANFLRDQVDKKGMIDVGIDVERELSSMDLSDYDISRELNISKERLSEALYILQKEGYEVHSGRFDQINNPGQKTTQKVLCPPGTPHKEIFNLENIHTIQDYTSHDGGDTFDKFVYPKSLDSKRLKVLLADEVGPDGERGVDKDGLIQIRRGVDDLSLDGARYSQVRILVDDNKYLKGMAVYSDNMPDGVDVIFNSNKTSYEKALKDIKTDDEGKPLENPFGSAIKPNGQSYYTDANGNKQLRLINKTRDEGDWNDWTDALPAQFLSKQPLSMVTKQLNMAKADKQAEYEAICELNNPTIKKHYLKKFAESCDSAAVHLKAAALPGQKYRVMIPINTLKDNEVYAPQFENGTKLALIRYPHAGTFEIPILTVNNKHAPAKKILGSDEDDAIGVSKKNAERLSGADFDGDTVMCIPTHNGNVKITSIDPSKNKYYKQLEGFDPQMEYAERPGMKYMKDPITGTDATQAEMGKISNLITDMTLFGAPPEEMVRAVKHSMVVIDAGKHKLDYKRSEAENDIAGLKRKWQKDMRDDDGSGAATIVSKAKGQTTIDKRQGEAKTNIKGKPWYDPDRPEGALIYQTTKDLHYAERVGYDKETGEVTYRTTDGKKLTYNIKDAAARKKYTPVHQKIADDGTVYFTNEDGDITYRSKKRTQASTQMAETDDAYSLVSTMRHPTELAYADYANSMKALANKARLEYANTKETEYSAAAKRTYLNEVNSLMAKLNEAQLNSPREREAQRRANVEVDKAKAKSSDLKKSDIRKIGQQAISSTRNDVGSIKRRDRNIVITDKEWEAIQAGAISKTQLGKILNNTDADSLRERAMPRSSKTLSASQISRVKQLSKQGYTLDEIAKKMGKSPSTVSNYLKGVS